MTKEPKDPIIALYRNSFPDFARMVRRMGGDLEGAKDAFHDALLIYMEKEKAGTLRLQSSPRAYLIGTARICWLHRQDNLSIQQFPADFEAAGSDDIDTEEREKSLLESLLRSGKKCMELLKAFYYDNSSMQEIATRFGFNGKRSATVQKYKCLEKVREEIKTTSTYAQ